VVRRFREAAGPRATLDVVATIPEARVRLIGRAWHAIVVVTDSADAAALGTVQALASTGQAPVLLVAPRLSPADEFTAFRLGAAEYLRLDQLTSEAVAATLLRLRARGEHQAAWVARAALFEALVERDADGLLALDPGLLITYASAGAERLLGYSPEEVVGRSALEFVPPEGTDEVLRHIGAALEHPGDHIMTQALVRHADGSDRRIEGTVVNLLGDPPVHALIVTFRDATDRLRQERELADKEQRFRELAEQAPVMMWMEDADRRLIWENQTALAFIGRSWEEEREYGWLDTVHPEDLERVRGHYQETTVMQRGFTLEFRMRRHDGVYCHVLQIAIPRWSDRGTLTGFLGVDIDITELKERAARIEEAEARYRQIADTVPVIVWMDDAEHHLTYLNQTAEKFSGRSLTQEAGTAWYDGIHPEDRGRVLASYRATSATPVPYQHMYRMRRYDGTYRWFIEIGVPRYSVDGEFTGFTGVDVDVHDLKEASHRLEEAEARYRHFIEQSTEGIWRLEMEKPVPIDLPPDEQIRLWYERCVFAECNLAMARMYGFDSAEDLIGVRLEAILPADNPANIAFLHAFIGSGYRLVNAETQERDRHGRAKYIMNNLVGLIEDGRLVRSWGTQQDITERRVLEEEARQSRKIETAGRLAGGIAHDFNNLLTAILGTSEILLHELPPGIAAREDVEEIKRAATRAANLTRQLLAFSRRQVLQPRVLDLAELVSGVESMLRRLIGEHITLLVRNAPLLWRIRADGGQLEQVIVNLSLNARDAMPTGGTLTIETTNCAFEGVAHGPESIIPPGPYVLLSVSDTGTGMDEETLRHLFEPFFTTKEPGKGTGLGLATVYGIVKQSDGFIYPDTQMGRGSRFRIYLPRVEGAPDRPEPVVAGAAPVRAQGTVLLVEDEEAVRRLARRVLEGVGYRVLEAANGAEALVLADGWKGPLDLVVTDVIMPVMSGQELSARLRQLRPGLRILYVSGYTDDAILQHGDLLPNTAFLQKPFTPGSLAQRVREVLAGNRNNA
jgi:PAS domain S-box-containing protein